MRLWAATSLIIDGIIYGYCGSISSEDGRREAMDAPTVVLS